MSPSPTTTLASPTFSESSTRSLITYYPAASKSAVSYRKSPQLSPFIPAHVSGGVDDNDTALKVLSQNFEHKVAIDKQVLQQQLIAFINESPGGTSMVFFYFFPLGGELISIYTLTGVL
jgi:hypothetical protein